MHPYVATVALSALLVLAGSALSAFDGAAEPAATHAGEHGATPTSRSGHGHGAGAHPWEGGKGTTPSGPAILAGLDRRSSIVIESDDGFNPANGVRSGTGSFDDPFVISGWYVGTIYIHDTTAAFEIKENYVGDILILDWTGAGGYVHHNVIHNLRTNRNVERVGDPSATVIERNEIHRVEELRHFDGILRHNTIGQEPILGLVSLGPAVVLNIAGLNGAGIHDNLVLGGVDMKIHGHHHSDRTGAHSHNHGRADEAQAEDPDAPADASSRQSAVAHVEDHQTRYVDFLFANNTIRDAGFGLRYNDLNHAGDDRTATSEQEPDLEKPHVHHTRVTIAHNAIEGATLRVATLNAPDERHLPGQTGELRILGNKVIDPSAGDGLVVQDVADARVLVEGNRVERGDVQLSGSSGILLQRFRNASVEVGGNWLGAYRYGIRASDFDANTTWSARGNSATATEYPVYWDDSVANPPEGSKTPASHEHGTGNEALADVGRTPGPSRFIRVPP